MKRTLLTAMLTIVLFSSCGKKEESPKEETTTAVNEPVSEVDRLEGKVVESVTGEWFVIKDGQRWRAMSEPATTDYLNSIADGNNHVEKNVSQATLDQFPAGGEILPKLEFKPKQ